MQVKSEGRNVVAIAQPTGAFGELVTTELLPRVQIDAIYGILSSDHETYTDGSSGSAGASGNLFRVTTGTSIGGYGTIRSHRTVRYRVGQGCRFRFTARFATSAANSLQGAGAFNSEDGLFVGYSGTAFGFMRRVAGAAHITRLTLSAGAGGAENVTVTLNDVAFVVAVTAGSAAQTAEQIAEYVSGFTGWSSTTSPQSNGATVTFIQRTPAAVSGAFTLSSTGTTAGTFATVQAGAANDNSTGWVPQTSWNVDRMDGTGLSGYTLDPTKLNVYEIIYGYLGAATITLRVMLPSGEFATAHRILYPGSAAITSQRNPTFRVGWFAASLGSTTNLTVEGGSAAGFIEGGETTSRDPRAATNGNYSASTSEYCALAIRVRGEFASTLNQRVVALNECVAAVETANRIAGIRLVLNPTMTGHLGWQYVSQTGSSVEYCTPTTIAVTGGQTILQTVTSGTATIDLGKLDLRLEPGDVLAVAIATVSSTSAMAVALNWQER